MSVSKRNTSKGETDEFHYGFQSGGKRYRGVCIGCTTKKEAQEFEESLKEKSKELVKQKTVKALVENFREELSGGGKVFLRDAFEQSLNKPRKKYPCKRRLQFLRGYWNDFLAFIAAHSPSAELLSDVTHSDAEAYVACLRKSGRYVKEIGYKRDGKKISYSREYPELSNNTCNGIQVAVSSVFRLMAADADLTQNPFDNIPKLPAADESRDPFTDKV